MAEQMKTTLIKNARAVVTCDALDRVYYDVDILISGGKILKIEPNLQAEYNYLIDANGCMVYPGLINTHHHFFQTFVRNLQTVDYSNITVLAWIEEIYRIFQLVDEEAIYYSSLIAMADLVKHGCTCAFDHQYCYSNTDENRRIDRQMEAAKQIGIRYHAGRGVNTLHRDEGGLVPDNMVETLDTYLADCERLIKLYHDPELLSTSRIVLAPCQPINCTEETFRESARLARSKHVQMHTHLGEGENESMLSRWGVRTLDFCEERGFIGADVWIAHGWELTKAECKRLAQYQTGVSHCPTPAILGGFPIINIKEMQEAGVNVSLGCDGSATNDSSNLLDAMRCGWMMQTFFSKNRGGCISPYEMLKVATINGAKTLGRDDIGSLEPDKAADLFMIDANKLELSGALHDPRNLLVRVGLTGPVRLTMMNGNVVWNGTELTGIDEVSAAQNAEKMCTRVIRKPSERYYRGMDLRE